jgi:tRNA threonylcarbamoyladenosine biosynthesis protein TsaE
MKNSVKVESEEGTKRFALQFAAGINNGDVIVLNGNLGAGKTFFIKEVCRYFDVKSVNSPTFALINEYTGEKKIYHFDFYRINRLEELYDIGFEDYLNDDEAVIFIEWGDLFPDILPQERIEINILIGKEENRTFEITEYK